MPSGKALQNFEDAAFPHASAAYNLARWLTGSHTDAEDVVQEAFLRAYNAYDSLRGADVRPWLLTIVRNTAYTWMRRNRMTSMVELNESLPCPRVNPEALALAAADSNRVRDAVASLPADYRTAIVLREFEDLSYKEIAAVTGAPVGTVMSRLSRAREWLKRTLAAPAQGGAAR